MGLIGSLLSAGSTAVSGFSVGTWIKIGVVVALALAFGGLYAYGQHEAAAVVKLQKETGAQQQIIADDKANIDALQKANQNWADAFVKYQKDAADQQRAYQSALAVKEKLNAQLAAIQKLLRSNPQAATAALNDLGHHLVCLLDSASGGAGDGCTKVPAVTPAPTPTARP